MGEISTTTTPTSTARKMPLAVVSDAVFSRGRSLRTMAMPMARMGLMSGATNMAPMITAALFCSSPRLAMTDAKIMST